MIRKLTALACAMLFSGMAWATDDTGASASASDDDRSFAQVLEDSDDSSTARNPNYANCYQYNQYGGNAAYYCQQNYSCFWNGRSCMDRQRPQPTRCEYLRDYYQCRQSGCSWDNRYGCSSHPQQPRRCEYIRNPHQCQSSGCYWDQRYGCSRYAGGGGNPGGGGNIYQCTAKDTGREGHWGGHTAQGRSQWEAQQAALSICQRPRGVHDRCVISSCARVR